MMRPLALALAALPTAGLADFTQNNLLAIFYHELGHAIIHQMNVPIYGQEEDAADALSILMIDALYEPDVATEMAYDSAALFWAESGKEPAFWDTHGPDEQRFFNTVCLFYGADPDTREGFAEELGLPEERALGCADEFDLAAASWNSVLDEMAESNGLSGTLKIEGHAPDLMVEEIALLNAEFKWPRDVTVRFDSCGEANAYYDLDAQEVTMCTELTGWLDEIKTDLGL